MALLEPPPKPPLNSPPYIWDLYKWQLRLWESQGQAQPSGDRLDRLEGDAARLAARPWPSRYVRDLIDFPRTFTAGDVLYVDASGDLVMLAKGTDGQFLKLASGIPSWAAGGAGLALEDSAEADGSAEHLQVAITSTPSAVKRLEFHGRSIVPEIDNDSLPITVILSDDSELTDAVYDRSGWFKDSSAVLGGVENADQTSIGVALQGNAANEYLSFKLELLSLNTTAVTRKHMFFTQYRTLATGVHQALGFGVGFETSLSIKGLRIDTNNAGDMITSGVLQAWAQT